VELFEQIRRDRDREGLSIRALAERHGVHRRAVRQALTIRLAVDFWSWRNLTAHGGLSDAEACGGRGARGPSRSRIGPEPFDHDHQAGVSDRDARFPRE
jgi:hypothetical protein